MEIKDFIDRCLSEGYELAEKEYDGKAGFLVGSRKFNTAVHFTPEAICNNDWPMLNREIVQGKNVIQVTRVVGYFSRVNNWNRSKIGELKDRRSGDYKVE